LSPDEAERCDCGFDFSKSSPELERDGNDRAQQDSLRRLIGGLALFVGGIGLAVASESSTGPGPFNFVTFGAIISGLGLAGRSLTRLVDLKRARKGR
jgi:hypothetical protein